MIQVQDLQKAFHVSSKSYSVPEILRAGINFLLSLKAIKYEELGSEASFFFFKLTSKDVSIKWKSVGKGNSLQCFSLNSQNVGKSLLAAFLLSFL